jgi:hypothetical protein
MLWNPTGGTVIRSDPAGSGKFKAPRGHRLHAGEDYLCQKGQWVFAPMSGILTRGLYVYPEDYIWKGLVISDSMNRGLVIRLYYVEVLEHKIGTKVVAGEKVGKAQAISERYPGQGMKDHVHMDIELKFSHTLTKGNKIYISPQVLGVGLPGV